MAAGATTPTVHTIPGELEELQSVLHFPEEVALRITDAEYQLFYQVQSKIRVSETFMLNFYLNTFFNKVFFLCVCVVNFRMDPRYHQLNISNM